MIDHISHLIEVVSLHFLNSYPNQSHHHKAHSLDCLILLDNCHIMIDHRFRIVNFIFGLNNQCFESHIRIDDYLVSKLK